MSIDIPFTKMHGAGNDYVYIDALAHPVMLTVDLPALSRVVSDRHKGVGGDGLIAVCPPDNPEAADARMRMFNADGSESEMCGNGVRCVAKLVHDRGYATDSVIRIETGAGTLDITYTIDGGGRLDQASVDMGAPILTSERIPVTSKTAQTINFGIADVIDLTLQGDDHWMTDCGLDTRMTCVSMGNPHAVLYCEDVAALPLEYVGPVFEHHTLFPNRVNVHFVQIQSSGEVTMRTWERGSGITQACGTGACAVGVAGVLSRRTDRRILAHLPGGDLTIDWREDSDHVFMTGEAVEVFRGELRF